jgi:hypothetical protein
VTVAAAKKGKRKPSANYVEWRNRKTAELKAALAAWQEATGADAAQVAVAGLLERYSERNAMLVLMQRPGVTGPWDVNGTVQWRDAGRQVREGELRNPLWILAPTGIRRTEAGDTAESVAADGAELAEGGRKRYFRLVKLYDVTQTEPYDGTGNARVDGDSGIELESDPSTAKEDATEPEPEPLEGEVPAGAGTAGTDDPGSAAPEPEIVNEYGQFGLFA